MSRIKGPDGHYIGPFETEAQAETFEAKLTRLLHLESMATGGARHASSPVTIEGGKVVIDMGDPSRAAEMVEALRGMIAEGVKLHEFALLVPELAQAAIDAQRDLVDRTGHSEIVVDRSAKGELTARYKPPERLYRRKRPTRA